MLSTLDFAAKKKRNCKNSYPCGNSCISKNKNCRKKLKGQAKTYAGWLEEQASRTKSKNDISKKTKPGKLKAKKPSRKPKAAKTSIIQGGSERNNKKIIGAANKAIQYGESIMGKNFNLYSNNLGLIEEILEQNSISPKSTRAILNKKGELEAIASIGETKDSLYVNDLATAPKNLDKKDPGYVRGNGTKMIAEIAKESLDRGKKGRITLNALPQAIPFYEKVGFKITSVIDGGTFMTLDEKAARKLIDKTLDFEEEKTEEDLLEELELNTKGILAKRNDKLMEKLGVNFG